MVKPSAEIIQETRDQLTEFETVLISEEIKANPKFNPESIDIGYLRSDDNYWEATVYGAGDKKHDPEEVLNHALFRNETCELLYNKMGIVAPWFLTPAKMENLDVKEALSLIDAHTQKLRDSIKASFPLLSPTHPKYQKKMALGLFALCFAEQGVGLEALSTELGEIEDVPINYDQNVVPENTIDLLRTEGLENFLGYLQFRGGLGLGTIEEDADGEGSVYTVLTEKKGFCTEIAYTYFFVARRAGLNVGFAKASIDTNDADHMYNIVTLADGTKLAVDLAQQEINKKYSRSVPISLNQVLAGALHNYLIAKEESMSFTFETLNALYGRLLAFDSSDAEILSGYAVFLSNHAVEVNRQGDSEQTQYYTQEAARYCKLALQYGEDNAEVSYNVASIYASHPELGNSQPLYESVYETWKGISKQWVIDSKSSDQWLALANTALDLGHDAEALGIYERYLVSGIEMSANQLKGYARVLEVHAQKGQLSTLPTQDTHLMDSIDKSAVKLFNAGHPDEAGYLLERLWLASPSDSRFATSYRQALVASYKIYENRFSIDAMKVAERYQKSFPKEALGYAMAGKQYYKMGEYEKAASSFQMAMDLDPKDASHRKDFEAVQQAIKNEGATEAFNVLVQPFNEGQYSYVREGAGKALDKFPMDTRLQELYQEVANLEFDQLLDNKDWPNCIALAEDYSKRFPMDPRGADMLAHIYFEKQDFAKAAFYFDRAAKLNPSESAYKKNAAAARENLKIVQEQ